MSLDVYLREDVARALEALSMAGGGTSALINEEIERATREDRPFDNEALVDHLRVYRQGYNDALAALAAAFGIILGSYGVDAELDVRSLRLLDRPRAPVWGP